MDSSLWWPSFCGDRHEYDAFWSPAISINTSNPDLTLCFQRTALSWPPDILLWLAAPFFLWDLHKEKTVHSSCSFSRLNLIKTVSCIGLVLTSLLMIIWVARPSTSIDDYYVTPSDYVATSLRCVTLILALVLMRVEYCKGLITSGVMSFFWLLLMICEIVPFRSNIIRRNTTEVAADPAYFITYNVYFGLLLVQFLLTFVADQSAKPTVGVGERAPLLSAAKDGTKGDSGKPSPELAACFWSRLLFQWITWDVVRGYRKPITFDQLYRLNASDKCSTLIPKYFKEYFLGEKTGSTGSIKDGQRPHRPLWRTLFLCVGKDFLMAILYRAISIPIAFVNPQLLNMLITFVGSSDPHIWKGIVVAVGMLVVNFTFSVLVNNFLLRAFRAGTHARSIVNAAVYRKSLRLSSAAKKQTTAGQIVNLMSVDAQKVQDMYVYSTLLYSVPIMMILCIYFLWLTIGPSCLAGLGVLLILIPLNALYLARKAFQLQKTQMNRKDQRFRIMNEILAGMKVLKLYAWEPSFEARILSYREKELDTIKYANYINAFGSMCWLLSPYLISLAIFATYVLISEDNVLDANKAFVTLSLINMLNWPMSILPLGVANTTQGIVSVRRIGAFLDLDELEEDTTERGVPMGDKVVSVEDGTFTWNRAERPVLTNINLDVPRGSLVAIVGQVGSGKSSLIASILGELFKLGGRVRINGSLAYIPQQAWIQHATLRENILFGKPYNESKYNDIISACAMVPDIDMLPGRDQTEIGEKGINLSGGQKQRVSLARAVYQDEDIYVFDDPLSAVDAIVGKHIFEQVVGPKGILKDKTRLFVTHGITYLPFVDTIVVLRDGAIVEVGKYDELIDRNGTFADVIRSYLENELDYDESGTDTDDLRERLSMSRSGGETMHPYSTSGSETRLRRRSSGLRSQKSEGVEDDLKTGVTLIREEKEEEGAIELSVIKSYIRAGGYLMLNLVIWSHILFMVFQVLTNIWLSEWSGDVPVNVTYDRQRTTMRLGVYGGLGVAQLLFALAEAFAAAYGCYAASRTLHENLLSRILRAPMAFFDTTPLGRIMNRFSKDLDVLDANMPQFIRQWLFAIAPVITTIIIICYTTPIFAAVFVPLAILYILFQRLYVTAVRQWKRIDSVRRSPIYIHFDESVVGASSIRAYRRQGEFIDTCDRLIDESQRPWILIIHAYRWGGITMEALGACVVFFSSLFAVIQRDVISAGMAGLSVSYALQVTVFMNVVIRTSSELETYIVSVERINEYMNIDTEAPWQVTEKRPPAEWPNIGAVQFSEYCTRYRAGLDLVLNNIDCFLKPNEKVGIVGRTGAGKSSLSLALFRIIEAARGAIYIDGLNISDMGLHDLRRKISIIPQDPVVFSGTLRNNLDPFSLYTDNEIWKALTHAHLNTFVSDLPHGLQYECGDSGEALSVGQRQLLCLARALLRRSKILVLDEATAAVDFETDALIQSTIREQFADCTILTVAHRLHTVLDYDRIIVLDQGHIREFDRPAKLLADKKSIFYGMAKDAGLA